jgi:hypothetical protein
MIEGIISVCAEALFRWFVVLVLGGAILGGIAVYLVMR